jgi:formate/nitrite transporter
MNYCTPKEITSNTCQIGQAKASLSIPNMIILGILAGAYIAFGACGATMATHDIPIIGVARLVTGAVFATGLMMVIIAGAELFTGNVLIWIGVLERKVTLWSMLRNWFWVYIFNFAGSIIVVYLMYWSGIWNYNNGLVGAAAIKIAVSKLTIDFWPAVVRGILCNWLVCVAVWMAYASKDVIGKIFGIFFPITLFVCANFEHSIANMYFIPAGILAKTLPLAAGASHLETQLDILTWNKFFTSLVPVTIGNIIGAVVFVASFYWFTYLCDTGAKTGPPVSKTEAR